MKEYPHFDMSILENKKRMTISTTEALKDIIPISWSDDVLNNEKLVTVTKAGERK
mgnify:FL=1